MITSSFCISDTYTCSYFSGTPRSYVLSYIYISQKLHYFTSRHLKPVLAHRFTPPNLLIPNSFVLLKRYTVF